MKRIHKKYGSCKVPIQSQDAEGAGRGGGACDHIMHYDGDGYNVDGGNGPCAAGGGRGLFAGETQENFLDRLLLGGRP